MSQSEMPSEMTGSQQQTPMNSQSEKPADAQDKSNADDKRLSLAEIFKEDNDDADSDASADGKDGATVESIDALVKRLKLTPEQVYAIKVPMKDNAEPLTIGALKDRVGELVDLDTREMQFDQRRVKQEGELLRAQNEMREVLAMLPKEAIKPELIERLRKQRDTQMAHEQRATMEMIPEWSDEKRRIADMTGMVEHLSEYGFPESFLSTVNDHRAMKYIRDNYLRDKRIKDALAKVTTPQKNGQRPSPKSMHPAQRPSQRSNSQRHTGAPDNRARIMDILNASEK